LEIRKADRKSKSPVRNGKVQSENRKAGPQSKIPARKRKLRSEKQNFNSKTKTSAAAKNFGGKMGNSIGNSQKSIGKLKVQSEKQKSGYRAPSSAREPQTPGRNVSFQQKSTVPPNNKKGRSANQNFGRKTEPTVHKSPIRLPARKLSH
jgi:hypothetical protein